MTEQQRPGQLGLITQPPHDKLIKPVEEIPEGKLFAPPPEEPQVPGWFKRTLHIPPNQTREITFRRGRGRAGIQRVELSGETSVLIRGSEESFFSRKTKPGRTFDVKVISGDHEGIMGKMTKEGMYPEKSPDSSQEELVPEEDLSWLPPELR